MYGREISNEDMTITYSSSILIRPIIVNGPFVETCMFNIRYLTPFASLRRMDNGIAAGR